MTSRIAFTWLICATAAHAQITGVEGRVPPPTSDDWNRIVGSYHIRLCDRGGSCNDDSDRKTQETFVVSIQRDAINVDSADADSRFVLEVGSAGNPREANACYASQRFSHTHRSYAGQIGAGIFSVRPEHAEPTISLILGGTVDAFYVVTAVIDSGRLEGIGQSEGGVPDGASASWPKDTIVGVRIGPPDTRPCIEAARALAIKWRREGYR